MAIVGRESMLVRSKAKGNILFVDRQVPRELLRVIAAHLRKEKYAKKIKESLYREALQELYDDSVEHAAGVYGGFERDTWQHLCNVVPFKVSCFAGAREPVSEGVRGREEWYCVQLRSCYFDFRCCADSTE